MRRGTSKAWPADDSPRAIEGGTLQRLVDGHEKILKGEAAYDVSPQWFDEEEDEVTGEDAGYHSCPN